MAIHTGTQAWKTLGALLGTPPADDGTDPSQSPFDESYPFLRDVPEPGLEIHPPRPPQLWAESSLHPPLRDPKAYDIADGERVIDRLLLGQTPAEMLSSDDAATKELYCRHSIDITMRGGTTSGVVYPTAVCELARNFCFRNVGGASAGAIAAAAAAAAEVGRLSSLAADVPTSARRSQGHVRQGFAGLADTMAWLAEIDEPGRSRYRVAQLFRPTQAALPIFRLLVSSMRKRFWVMPLLLVGAFGWVSKAANFVLLVGAVMLAGYDVHRHGTPAGDSRWDWVASGALGLAGLLTAAGTLVAIGIFALAVSAHHRSPPAQLAEPVRTPSTPSTRRSLKLLLTLAGGVACSVEQWCGNLPVPTLLRDLLFLLVALVAVTAASAYRLSSKAAGHRFGLVSGSSNPVRPSVWNWIAGMPKRTVDRPLVVWLSETLSELAGLETSTPLRFGHLWFGAQWKPGAERDSVLQDVLREPGRRRVNLELVTTELVQGLGYRFPLPTSAQTEDETSSRLYVRRSELESSDGPLFPPEVIDILCPRSARPQRMVLDRDTGDCITEDLYALPEPWDLPVIVAVRMSMSLPVLLQAVPMWRLQEHGSHVRDEFGLTYSKTDVPDLLWPTGDSAWAERLWFSDGGITSNFPVHLFDSLLPLWPTVGINLGKYPAGQAHQDVWLPQDWQSRGLPGAPVSGGLPGFLGAIVSTARGWRDNAQAQMPSYVGRIATVRQGKSEGGTNLFMTKETIAGLALRGAFAGARLGRRFGSEQWWRRHQWLRFRTTASNLEAQRSEIRDRIDFGAYAGLTSRSETTGQGTSNSAARWGRRIVGALRAFVAILVHGEGSAGLPAGATAPGRIGGATFDAIKAQLVSGDPDLRPRAAQGESNPDAWYPAKRRFFRAASVLIGDVVGVPAAPVLGDGPPLPEPELRAVPPS